MAAATSGKEDGRLNPKTINAIFNEVTAFAGLKGKSPHDARHTMGRKIMEAKKNAAAVARQLNHSNLSFSAQYARVTSAELLDVIDED